MRVGRAILAGVIAGAVMSIFMLIGRASGVDIELESLLGSLAGVPPGKLRFLVGLAIHLALSGTVALAYAAVFERLAVRACFRVGVMLSFAHVGVVAALLVFVPRLRMVVPTVLFSQGSFIANLDRLTILAFIVLHAIYGAVVGRVYMPTEKDVFTELGLEPGTNLRTRAKAKPRAAPGKKSVARVPRYARSRT